MASPTPSLGQGLLLFCEMYAGALAVLAIGFCLAVCGLSRNEPRSYEETDVQ